MSESTNLSSRFYTSAEIASLFRVSLQTVWNWSSTGNGPVRPVKVSGRLLWPRDTVEQVLTTDRDTGPDAQLEKVSPEVSSPPIADGDGCSMPTGFILGQSLLGEGRL